MLYKNVFITGEKQIGKSTLIKKVIQEMNLKPSGFVTLPYEINQKNKGHYLHSLVDSGEYENDIPISIKHRKEAVLPVPWTFDVFGTYVLQKSRTDASTSILMDELGVLEESAEHFKAEVFACLNCHKRIVGIIKKAESHFLNHIREREDCLVLELANHNRWEIYNQLKTMLK